MATRPGTWARGRRWTDEERKKLAAMFPVCKVKEIAAFLDRPYQAVKAQAQKQGLSKVSPWTDEANQQLRQLYADGVSVKRIAEQLGRTYGAVTTQISCLDLASRRPSHPIGFETRRSSGAAVRKVTTGMGWFNFKRIEVIEWERIHGPVPEGYELMVINTYRPKGADNLQLIKKGKRCDVLNGRNNSRSVRELINLQRQLEQAVARLAKADEKPNESCATP